MDGDRPMYPDRSALLCKQLGVRLHELNPDNLPLIDVLTGQRIGQDVDQEVVKYVWECLGMWMCGSVDVWMCGNVDVWMCGNVDVWTCGNVDVWMCGNVDVWMCGNVDVWTCGNVDVWMCGNVDVWMCGNVDVWEYGVDVDSSACVCRCPHPFSPPLVFHHTLPVHFIPSFP